jgi:Flp pilus assembly protein TadG
MKTIQFYFRGMRNQKGTVLIFVTIAILCLLAFVALAIDTGYVMVTRNELQNVSDASALAATRQLGFIYEGLTYQQQDSFVLGGAELDLVKNAALNVAASNKAGQENITLNDADIIIGQWDTSTKNLTPTFDKPDAVRVISRRDTANPTNGPIRTFFARIFGYDTANVNSIATAALTGESTADAGGLPIPIGISQIRATNGCGENIDFSPTKDSCASWHTYLNHTSSATQIREIIQTMLPPELRIKQYEGDPAFVSPATNIYDTEFNFTGGEIASNREYFNQLFDYMKTRDGDGDDLIWTSTVVIFEESGTVCGNENKFKQIVGFATIKMEDVSLLPDEKIIRGTLICDYVEPGRGGGGNYGTMGSIPGLVQ